MSTNSDFKDAYDAGIAHAAATAGSVETIGDDVLVLRHGATVTSLERFQSCPASKRTELQLFDVASFAIYVNRHKSAESTTVFADLESGNLAAILDYHSAETPDWGKHRAWLMPRLTKEWRAWTAANKKSMEHVTFAEFVEEHIAEIAEPSGGALLDAVTKLELKRDVHFTSQVHLQDGRIQFAYSEDVAGGTQNDNVTLPREFTLGLVPFEGSDPFRVYARLRYRLKDGKIAFWFELVQLEQVFQAAVKARIEEVEAATSLTVLRGLVPAAVVPLV